MKWYHGGPKIAGERILPPTVTGADSLASLARAAELEGAEVMREDRVFLTTMYDAAVLYAAMHFPHAWVYECEPIGEVEDDPDFHGTWPEQSIQVPEARIVRRFKPSNAEVNIARYVITEGR